MPTPFTSRASVSMSIGSIASTRLTVLRLSTQPRSSLTAGLSAGTRSSMSSSRPVSRFSTMRSTARRVPACTTPSSRQVMITRCGSGP